MLPAEVAWYGAQRGSEAAFSVFDAAERRDLLSVRSTKLFIECFLILDAAQQV
jgi:hypothetical protein